MTRTCTRAGIFPSTLLLVGTTVIFASVLIGCHHSDSAAAHTGADQMVIGTENIAIAKQGAVDRWANHLGHLERGFTGDDPRANIGVGHLNPRRRRANGRPWRELLGQLDASAIRDAYTSAHSNVASAQNAFDIATRDLQRNKTLLAAGAIAQRDLETSQQAYNGAQATLENAKAQLANAQKNLDNTKIIAPFHGVVSQRSVSVGDVVQPGERTLHRRGSVQHAARCLCAV